MFDRIARNWVYGTGPAALLLLVLAPILLSEAPGTVWLAYLALPAYMLHQVEEHDADRFRLFVNALMGPQRAGLSHGDVAVINLGLVWLPFAVVIGLVVDVNGGWGATAGWLMLVNAVAHIGQALALRRRNPGVFTAIGLFLPLGLALVLGTGATLVQQVTGFVLALALHAAIVARAVRPAPQVPA